MAIPRELLTGAKETRRLETVWSMRVREAV